MRSNALPAQRYRGGSRDEITLIDDETLGGYVGYSASIGPVQLGGELHDGLVIRHGPMTAPSSGSHPDQDDPFRRLRVACRSNDIGPPPSFSYFPFSTRSQT
jgi:hypothetical protein